MYYITSHIQAHLPHTCTSSLTYGHCSNASTSENHAEGHSRHWLYEITSGSEIDTQESRPWQRKTVYGAHVLVQRSPQYEIGVIILVSKKTCTVVELYTGRY